MKGNPIAEFLDRRIVVWGWHVNVLELVPEESSGWGRGIAPRRTLCGGAIVRLRGDAGGRRRSGRGKCELGGAIRGCHCLAFRCLHKIHCQRDGIRPAVFTAAAREKIAALNAAGTLNSNKCKQIAYMAHDAPSTRALRHCTDV